MKLEVNAALWWFGTTLVIAAMAKELLLGIDSVSITAIRVGVLLLVASRVTR